MNNTNNNNAFSFSRFRYVLRHDLSVTKRTNFQYALFLAILAIVIGFICGIIEGADSNPSGRAFTWAWIYIGGFALCVSCSIAFNQMAKPSQRLAMLMLPASYSEKFASRFVIYLFGCILLLLVTFLLGDLARILTLCFTGLEFSSIKIFSLVKFSNFDFYQFLSYVQYPALFILGSIFFPRLAFIKTAGLIAAMSVISCIITIYMMFRHIKEGILFAPSEAVTANPMDHTSSDLFYTFLGDYLWITILINGIFFILYTLLAYYRLKQTEIINRW